MTGWYDAQNLLDILDHALIVLGAVGVAAVPSWFAHRNHAGIKSLQAQTAQIKGQVVNGHADAPPLRADLDKLAAAVERLERGIEGLHEGAADEKVARRTELRELREDVDARFTALNKRI